MENAPLPAYYLAAPVAFIIVIVAFYFLIKYAVKSGALSAYEEIESRKKLNS